MNGGPSGVDPLPAQTVIEIDSVDAFREIVRAGAGVIVINDPRRRVGVAHSVRCDHVREARFVEKVLLNRNGAYYWGPDVATVAPSLGRQVSPCKICGAQTPYDGAGR
jgi:hypothetical protein